MFRHVFHRVFITLAAASYVNAARRRGFVRHRNFIVHHRGIGRRCSVVAASSLVLTLRKPGTPGV